MQKTPVMGRSSVSDEYTSFPKEPLEISKLTKYGLSPVPEECEHSPEVDMGAAVIQEKMARLVQDAGEIFTSAVVRTVHVVPDEQIPGAPEGLTFRQVIADLWDTFRQGCLNSSHLECHDRSLVLFQVAMYTAAACLSRSELINVFLQVRRRLLRARVHGTPCSTESPALGVTAWLCADAALCSQGGGLQAPRRRSRSGSDNGRDAAHGLRDSADDPSRGQDHEL